MVLPGAIVTVLTAIVAYVTLKSRIPGVWLLDVLVCPLTKGPLVYDRGTSELVSRAAGLAYPIRDGIPIMLPEDARRLDEA